MREQHVDRKIYIEAPLPRPIHAETEYALQAPVDQDRSFFIKRETSQRCPTDAQTGMPLPIAPTINVDALPGQLINEHHHFYPRLSPLLRDTAGGRALRVSRIQRVAITQHNFGEDPFHKYFPEGPEISADPREQLGMCVLACAGYLPDLVVDVGQGEPEIRLMKNWEFDRLRQPHAYLIPLPHEVKRFRDRRYPSLTLTEAKTELLASREKQAALTYRNLVYGFDPIKKFMAEQVLGQDFTEVKRRTRQKFLRNQETSVGLSMLAIGSMLASKAATVQGEPLEDVYARFLAEGRIHPLMPSHPATLIKNKLGHVEHRVGLLHRLRRHLEASEQVAVA